MSNAFSQNKGLVDEDFERGLFMWGNPVSGRRRTGDGGGLPLHDLSKEQWDRLLDQHRVAGESR
ncbi:MAG: hypothetical protein WCA32_10315 [Chromatiaceae bacterium]